jgi:hypothetical protein
LAFLPTATPAFRATIAVHIPAAALLALQVLRMAYRAAFGVLMMKGV